MICRQKTNACLFYTTEVLNSRYIRALLTKFIFITTPFPYQLSIDGEYLTIVHQNGEEKCIFDVCDLNGRIRISGTFQEAKDRTVIHIGELVKGKYHLFIINNGIIHKQIISIS